MLSTYFLLLSLHDALPILKVALSPILCCSRGFFDIKYIYIHFDKTFHISWYFVIFIPCGLGYILIKYRQRIYWEVMKKCLMSMFLLLLEQVFYRLFRHVYYHFSQHFYPILQG